MKRILGIAFIIVLLGLLVWGGVFLYRRFNAPQEKLSFQTEKVSRGDLRSTISASGGACVGTSVGVGSGVGVGAAGLYITCSYS